MKNTKRFPVYPHRAPQPFRIVTANGVEVGRLDTIGQANEALKGWNHFGKHGPYRIARPDEPVWNPKVA